MPVDTLPVAGCLESSKPTLHEPWFSRWLKSIFGSLNGVTLGPTGQLFTCRRITAATRMQVFFQPWAGEICHSSRILKKKSLLKWESLLYSLRKWAQDSRRPVKKRWTCEKKWAQVSGCRIVTQFEVLNSSCWSNPFSRTEWTQFARAEMSSNWQLGHHGNLDAVYDQVRTHVPSATNIKGNAHHLH